MIFRRIEREGIRWVINEDFMNNFPVGFPKNVEDVIGNDVVLQSKASRTSLIIKNGWDNSRDIVVKIYRPRCWSDFLKYLFRKSKAETEWKMYQRLRDLGIPTPVPLGMGIKRRHGFLLESYLIIEAVSPGQTLFEYARNNADAADVRRRFICLARHVAELHNKGFYYSDLQAYNIIIPANGGEEERLYFIDLHRVLFLGRVPGWLCVRDLARLNSSVYTSKWNRCRFMKIYLQIRGLYTRRSWRQWIIDVDNRTWFLWAESLRGKSKANKQKYNPWQNRLRARGNASQRKIK